MAIVNREEAVGWRIHRFITLALAALVVARVDLTRARGGKILAFLTLAGLLICLGLLVQLLSLIRIHPLSFMAFMMISCPLVLAGILLFLYSIISSEPKGGKSA
jgi:hypothetical protein